MALTARIRHVNAFTSVPLEGNPAAVVDGVGIDEMTMRRIALNQHLSETVFLLPPRDPANHMRLRIFTPGTELPFAGHPTIASSHIIAEERLVDWAASETLRLETMSGLITVVADAATGIYTMTQRPPEFRPAKASVDDVARWLGLRPGEVIRSEDVTTGVWWHIGQVASFEAMLRIKPNPTLLEGQAVSLFCIGSDSDADVHIRTFAPEAGIFEDPVTGSSNGCIAALIARDRLLPMPDGELRYTAEQGVEMGQPGRIYLRVTGAPNAMSVEVGGHAVTLVRGELLLP